MVNGHYIPKIAFLLQIFHFTVVLQLSWGTRRNIRHKTLNHSLEMSGFFYVCHLAKSSPRLDFVVLFFLSIDSIDCIDTKISTGMPSRFLYIGPSSIVLSSFSPNSFLMLPSCISVSNCLSIINERYCRQEYC